MLTPRTGISAENAPYCHFGTLHIKTNRNNKSLAAQLAVDTDCKSL